MSKESDECYTPIEIIRSLGEFDLDPACGVRCKNKTAKRRYTERGLVRKWSGRVWLNPPYSEIMVWANKFREHGNGIMLLCFSGHAVWLRELLRRGGAVFFFADKPKFIRPNGTISTNRYVTCLVPIGQKNVDAIARSGLRGHLLVTHHSSCITTLNE